MTQVAETNRARFADTHPTAARVGRFFGRRIPSAVTGTASAISFFALSSAAAPVSGILVATALVMLITEAVSQPFTNLYRRRSENRELNEHLKANINEINGLKEQIRGLQTQLDEQRQAIGKATLESLAAKESVIFRLEHRIPTLQKMEELLVRAAKLSRGLMEAGVALPRMKKMQKGVLGEIEIFNAHQKAISEEIQDLKTVIEQIRTGNRSGLEHLNKAHYIYVRDLGQGGMGKAQLYYYAPQDAWVVIKTILSEYQQDPELVERFRREATIAKELNHPNLAKGFGYGGDEFVEGEFAMLPWSAKYEEQKKEMPISPEEFEAVKSITDNAQRWIQILCRRIDADKYEWLPHSNNNTIERINELLSTADFYDTCWQVKKVDVRLPQEALRLIDKTNGYRNKTFAELSEIERNNIIRLNRILLEAGYPEICPHGRLYSVTEFIRGKNMDEMIYNKKPDPEKPGEKIVVSANKLPPIKVARIAIRALEALEYMSQRGIIHRDLKPENIMIDADGNPILIDFGLARQVGDIDKMTRTAAALGTQYYMAPEQLRADRDLTDKVDTYALAEIVFECLTGITLFGFGNWVDLINAKSSNEWVQGQIEASEDVPQGLKEILIRMMLIEKENRPNHAEIYAAFQGFLAAQEGTAIV